LGIGKKFLRAGISVLLILLVNCLLVVQAYRQTNAEKPIGMLLAAGDIAPCDGITGSLELVVHGKLSAWTTSTMSKPKAFPARAQIALL
jgi:hypothetical protein